MKIKSTTFPGFRVNSGIRKETGLRMNFFIGLDLNSPEIRMEPPL